MLSDLFCPLQCPDAALLTHIRHSFCQKEDDDGQVKATISSFLSPLLAHSTRR